MTAAARGDLPQPHVDLLDRFAGRETDLGVLALPEPGSLRWTVTGREDVDLEQLRWTLVRADGGVDAVVATGSLADPFGETLPPGDYALAISGEDLAFPPLAATVQPGAETVLPVELGTLREVTLTFQLSEDAPAEGPLRFRLSDAATGAPLYAHMLVGELQSRLSLPEGRYRLLADAAGGASAEVLVEVGAEPVPPVEVRLR